MIKSSCRLIRRVTVKEIKCYKISVRSAVAGQTCSLEIKLNNNEKISEVFESMRKGNVLIDKKPETLIQEFRCNLTLCNTTEEVSIGQNYEPVVFSETFKQSCIIQTDLTGGLKLTKKISRSIDTTDRKKRQKQRNNSFYIDQTLSKEFDSSAPSIILKPNSINNVTLRLKFKPEYVKLGQKIMIYDQNLKVTGEVTELLY